MSYTVDDFSETLDRMEHRQVRAVTTVVAAWGEAGDYSEWSGGFLLFTGHRYFYVTGWCDTTGWGCQDGIEVTEYWRKPDLKNLEKKHHDGECKEWDHLPEDLNKYLKEQHANH